MNDNEDTPTEENLKITGIKKKKTIIIALGAISLSIILGGIFWHLPKTKIPEKNKYGEKCMQECLKEKTQTLEKCAVKCGIVRKENENNLCGDGVCGAKEISDPALCPKDCEVSQLTEICGPNEDGYCINFKEKCKSGYEGSGSGNCKQGRSAKCCVPAKTNKEIANLNYEEVTKIVRPQDEAEAEKVAPVEQTSKEILSSKYNDSPFGFHYASKLGDSVSDLGIRWVRVNAVWGILQSENDIKNGIYNWDILENKKWNINSYPKDTNFMITFSHLGTPVGKSNSYIPNDGVYTEESWIKFTKAVVNKYKDQVKYFQVENEPKPNLKDYAKLQKITYKAVKEECSECQVIMGGFIWGKGSFEEYDKSNLEIFQELNGNYVDIYDQHYFGNAKEYNPSKFLDHAKKRLFEANFNDIPIWITEMGDYSGDPAYKRGIDPPYQTELIQAGALFKRYISSLSYGVEKIFWAWGLYEGLQHDESYFDFTGLIYDGKYDHDLGYGIKKLTYYTYKLMTEKLEGSDWDNIETIQTSDNIYIYKFTNKNTGKPVWVAWSDSGSGSISLSSLGVTKAKVTEAVPNYNNGLEIEDSNVAYEDMFKESIVSGSIKLRNVPVFMEKN